MPRAGAEASSSSSSTTTPTFRGRPIGRWMSSPPLLSPHPPLHLPLQKHPQQQQQQQQQRQRQQLIDGSKPRMSIMPLAPKALL